MIPFLAFFLAALPQPVPATPAPCSAREAIRTSVVEIGRHPERFVDRCVTVTGAYAGIRMYSGREGLYLAHRFGRDGNVAQANLAHRIGIDNQDMRNLRMRFPQRTTVTGRVDSCERRIARIRAAGGIPFLGGYCHYEGGPTIVVSAYDISEGRYERMTGEAARRRYGNLAPMPSDWPARAQVEAVAAEFLQALRAGDGPKLAALHETNGETNEHGRALLFDLLHNPESVFAQARRAAPAQTAIFVSAAEDGTLLGREARAATICFCRTADCGDRWPIAFNDADNDPSRPYACVHAEPRDDGPRRIVLNTPIGGGWLSEPSATAYRATPNASTR
jgi:hypothetical protein